MNCKNDHKIRSSSSSQGSVLQLSWDCFAAIKDHEMFLSLLDYFYYWHNFLDCICKSDIFLHPLSYSMGREIVEFVLKLR